jgi:hypothetical protein
MSREPETAAARAEELAETVEAATEFVYCPECGMPAWIERADSLSSTSGPVEHVKVRCFSRHWFLMPRADLDR